MPTYSFRNKETGEEFEEFMTISSLDTFKENNPHLEQLVCGAPIIGDPMRLGRVKPSEGFRTVMKNIKKQHLHNNINII